MLALITIPVPSLPQMEALVYEEVLQYNMKNDISFDEKLIALLPTSVSVEDFILTVVRTLSDHPRPDYLHHICEYLQVVWETVICNLESQGLALLENPNQSVYGRVYAVNVRNANGQL